MLLSPIGVLLPHSATGNADLPLGTVAKYDGREVVRVSTPPGTYYRWKTVRGSRLYDGDCFQLTVISYPSPALISTPPATSQEADPTPVSGVP